MQCHCVNIKPKTLNSKPKTIGVYVKVELDLSYYATKSGLKVQQLLIHQILNVEKLGNLPSNFVSLKSKLDELDIVNLTTTPIDLSKLSGVGKNNVVKRTQYDKLVTKFNGIDISGLNKKVDY